MRPWEYTGLVRRIEPSMIRRVYAAAPGELGSIGLPPNPLDHDGLTSQVYGARVLPRLEHLFPEGVGRVHMGDQMDEWIAARTAIEQLARTELTFALPEDQQDQPLDAESLELWSLWIAYMSCTSSGIGSSYSDFRLWATARLLAKHDLLPEGSNGHHWEFNGYCKMMAALRQQMAEVVASAPERARPFDVSPTDWALREAVKLWNEANQIDRFARDRAIYELLAAREQLQS